MRNANIFLLFFSLIFVSCKTLDTNELKRGPHTLVLALDGVPVQFVEKLQAENILTQFQKPAPMVATFPSISDPNWNRILKMPKATSYTKSYFDPSKKSENGDGIVVGSLLDHIKETPQYENGFDHRVEGIMGHLSNLTWLETSARLWIDELSDEIKKVHDRNYYYAFTLNTDLIAHTQGEEGLKDFLVRLDRKITRIRRESMDRFGHDVEVILISDHGNDFVEPKMVAFETPLSEGGWNRKDAIHDPKDYAFVAPEILSFAAFYTKSGQEHGFADAISKLEGVHIAAYRGSTSNTILVESNGGSNIAEILVIPEEKKVSYKILKGSDPLLQVVHFKKGALNFDDYFNKSLNDDYPYAVVRLWEAFYENCELPGSVLVSTERGFAFSNPALELITAIKGLKSLHGSLRAAETRGLFVSTHRRFPPIRPGDFSKLVDLHEFKKNSLSSY